MKFKNYTRAIVVAMTAMLVFAGCKKDDPKPDQGGGSFAISVNGITAASATVMVVPTNMDMPYYVNVVEKANYTNDDALIASDLATLKAEADAASISLEAYLTANLEKGTSETEFTVTPGAQHYAYVYGLGTDGVSTTIIEKKEFTTGGGSDAFTITVSNLTKNSCSVTFVPADQEAGYFWNIDTKETIDQFGGIEKFDAYFAAYTEAMCTQNNCQPSDLATAFMSVGEDGDDMTGMKPNTTYYAFAFNIDDDFNKLGTVVSQPFTTLEAEPVVPSDLTFTIDITDVGSTKAHIKVTPSNNEDKFFVDIQPKVAVDQLGDDNAVRDELIAMYEAYGLMEYLTSAGIYEYLPEDFTGSAALDANTEYYVVVFGYEGGATTDLSKKLFKTEEAAPPVGSFEISVAGTDPYDMTIGVAPVSKEALYMWDVVSEEEYVAAGSTAEGCLQATYDYWGKQNAIYTPAYIVDVLAEMDDTEYKYILEPSMKHYVWSVYVNTDGTVAGETAIKEFTTAAASLSAATLIIECPKYYDGDELFAADPTKYANAKGKPWAPTIVTPNDATAGWHIGLFGTDYTSASMLSDAAAITNIIDTPRTGTTTINYMAAWQMCTYIGVAQDATGKFGPVVRLGIKFEKSKVSPVSDLVSASANAVTRLAMMQTATIMMPKLFNGKPIIAADRDAMRTSPKVTILPTRAEKVTNTTNTRQHFDLKAPSKNGMKRQISLR